jgi:hypothetical protein
MIFEGEDYLSGTGGWDIGSSDCNRPIADINVKHKLTHTAP